MRVWRSPAGGMLSFSTIRRICGSKPISSIRSASSSTRNLQCNIVSGTAQSFTTYYEEHNIITAWVSDKILNGTSLWFMLENTTPEDELKIQTIQKLNTTQKKQTMQKQSHSKSKLPWFSLLLRHSARKWDGLILQCSRDHTAVITMSAQCH